MNLQAIAAKAAALGMRLADSAATTWRLQYGTPTRTHNPTTDTTGVVWSHDDQNVRAIAYTPEDKRENPADANKATKALAFQAASLTAPAAIDETAIATDADGNTWQVTNVTPDPTRSLIILELRL